MSEHTKSKKHGRGFIFRPYFHSLKTVIGFGYLGLFWFSFCFLLGELSIENIIGLLSLSTGWIIITLLQLRHYFASWYRMQSRIRILTPLVLNVILNTYVLFNTRFPEWPALVGSVYLLIWLILGTLTMINKRNWLKNDGTLLPKDIWVSPPLEAIKGTESKLIWLITRGQFLPKHNIQRPGGHSEMLIYNQDGELDALSCYMAEGVVKNTAEDIIAHLKEVNEAYYVLLPKKDISPEQASKAQSIFAQMLAEDIAWKDATNARTARIVDSLPIPGEWKEWLKKKFYCTGYGWLGFFIGPGGGIIGRLRTILRWLGFKGLLPDGHEPRMWTCISFCVEFAHRLGLELEEYGHSMLLIGLLDPVMPDDPLADKNFYYLSKPIEQ